MAYEQIRYETRGPIATITLDRPDRLNAWTRRMSHELGDAIESANADAAVGAILVTGAGHGFCAGADIHGFRDQIQSHEAPAAEGDWVDLCRRSKPLIAAVNGACVGVGMTMILPFDVIVASERARFGMFFIKMGLVPELASTHFLVQRMGFGRANEMCLSGRVYPAEQAHADGLVDRLVASDDLLPSALDLATAMAENPAPQLRMTKRLLSINGSDTDFSAIQERESELLRECWKTPEHAEAVSAFVEKRPAKFR